MLLDFLSSAENHEELLLNIVATATNITFYASNMDVSPRLDISYALIVDCMQ